MCAQKRWWFDVLHPFQHYLSHIETRNGDNEMLCAMKPHMVMNWIPLPAGFEPRTLWFKVRSPNHFATQTLRPAKIQIILLRTWTESSLCVFGIAEDAMFLHADNGDSDQTTWMCRQIWAFIGCTCQKVCMLHINLFITPFVITRFWI